LFVGLPASYATEPTKRYPVVYVTDGYWDFQKVTTIHGPLVYDKYAPEFIWLLKYEDAFAKSGKALNARLYMTTGGNATRETSSNRTTADCGSYSRRWRRSRDRRSTGSEALWAAAQAQELQP
jgi:predicted alpha/beta superfamily hydrolase